MEGEHHHHHHGHETGHHHEHRDSNLRAAYLHVLADALTSVAAIVALLAGRYLGWVWLDPVIGVAGAIVIASWAWGLIKDTSGILLDTAEPELAATIRETAERTGATVADLHVWRIGPRAHAAIVSVTGDGGDTAAIRAALHAMPHVVHVTVERCP